MTMLDKSAAGNAMAKGAIDIALWDALGKHLGAPIHQLLGGAVRSSIPLLWPLPSQSPEEDVEEIRKKMGEGYRTFMLKMGVERDMSREVARVRAANQFYGESRDFHLCVDPNQGWGVIECKDFLRLLSRTECRLDFIEQPLPRSTSASTFAAMHAQTLYPISLDESIMTAEDCRDALAAGIPDIVALKVSKNGGITPSQKIATLCEVNNVRILCNSMLEFGITQAATLNIGTLSLIVANLCDNLVWGG
eukprot:TRINITY_DN1233_c0_g1_i3.p1 TRINITY_DN1233_c0_g1~~TRINITY_DN1233_c0_g1_i3.p1  ORF type:complete len:249 (-),score=47.45 TRINITY_DN1233_c0_g1_i3:466-1212(-)